MTNSEYQMARRFAVAPMLAYTNRHARYFYRLLGKKSLLYTEMIHSQAALGKHGDRELAFNDLEKPLAVQLAGYDIQPLVDAALKSQEAGYDAVNLNIGCPSNKVRMGTFGACLMYEPRHVAAQVNALGKALHIPVTVKCRLGVDEQDYQKTLPEFLTMVHHAGCNEVIIHARKALLKKLNPKQNRDIPPLDYDFVYRCKKTFPSMHISINGGITTVDDAVEHLQHIDGVMLGRAVINNPVILRDIDSRVFNEPEDTRTLMEILEKEYSPYLSEERSKGVPMPPLVRPVINLFKGRPGGGIFRKILSRHQSKIPLGDLLQQAIETIREYEQRSNEFRWQNSQIERVENE